MPAVRKVRDLGLPNRRFLVGHKALAGRAPAIYLSCHLSLTFKKKFRLSSPCLFATQRRPVASSKARRSAAPAPSPRMLLTGLLRSPPPGTSGQLTPPRASGGAAYLVNSIEQSPRSRVALGRMRRGRIEESYRDASWSGELDLSKTAAERGRCKRNRRGANNKDAEAVDPSPKPPPPPLPPPSSVAGVVGCPVQDVALRPPKHVTRSAAATSGCGFSVPCDRALTVASCTDGMCGCVQASGLTDEAVRRLSKKRASRACWKVTRFAGLDSILLQPRRGKRMVPAALRLRCEATACTQRHNTLVKDNVCAHRSNLSLRPSPG